jgi:hypothetical protein
MKENSLSLKYKNSFGVETIAKQIFYPDSVEDLQSLLDLTDQAFYVLSKCITYCFKNILLIKRFRYS